jgi:O-antigen/teichoic acid export membrane protein
MRKWLREKTVRSYLPTHLLVAASAWISRAVLTLTQFAVVRIALSGLGLEKYAVFMLLTSLTGWFSLSDFGVGASIQNYISEARANGRPYNDFVAAGGIVAALLLFLTIVILYFASPFIAPLFLKQFLFLDGEEKSKLFFVTGALSIGAGLGGVVYKIWYAEQKGHLSNIVPAAASLCGLVGLVFVKHMNFANGLFLSLLAYMVPTTLFPLISLAWKELRNLRECLSIDNLLYTCRLALKRGIRFWCFTVMAAGVLQIDYVIMSQFLVPRDIATYSISTKVFGLAFFIYNAILLALWPVFSEHIAKKQWERVIHYLKEYLVFGLVFMLVCTFALIWLMPVVVGLLSPRENIIVPLGFIILLGGYQMLRVWTDTFSTLLQSMNELSPLWLFVPLQAFISGGLQWYLTPRLGIYGVLCGLIGSFVFTVSWGLPVAVKRRYKLDMQETL